MSDEKHAIRRLQARPSLSVDLCFDTGGIIESANHDQVRLGEPIKAYDIKTALYSHLGQTIPGNDRG